MIKYINYISQSHVIITLVLFTATSIALADMPDKLVCEYTRTYTSTILHKTDINTDLAWFDFKKGNTAWLKDDGHKEYWPIEQGDDPHVWFELINGEPTENYYTFSLDYDHADYTWDTYPDTQYSRMRCKPD